MSQLVPVRYPRDPTGLSKDNYVENEPYLLSNKKYRIIIPKYGAYFKGSLSLFDTLRNVPLFVNIDYIESDIDELPTSLYNKEICRSITIINKDVSNQGLVSYQVLGGEYSTSMEVMLNLINLLEIDNRPVDYKNINFLPDGFNPAPHMHDIGDGYGFEYLVAAINRLNKIMLMGLDLKKDNLLDYIDNVMGSNGYANLGRNKAYNFWRGGQ